MENMLEERLVKADDGAELGYSFRPPQGNAPLVLLVHALAMDRSNWKEVVDALPRNHGVLAIDVRGHGVSTLGTKPLELKTAVDDILLIMDDAGCSRAVIVGCSMGGCIAQAFAIAHPERTFALTLIDTTSWYGPEAEKAWSERAQKARENGFSSLVPFQRQRWFSDTFLEANDRSIERTIETFLGNDIHAYEQACAMLANTDLRSGLSTISCPTRIIVGEEDYATPIEAASFLHSSIAGSELIVLKGKRHFTPIEAPSEIAAGIQSAADRAAG